MVNSSMLAAFRVNNGLAPKSGPKSIGVVLDFSVQNPLPLDLVVAVGEDQLEWVQTIFVDNSENPFPFSAQSLNGSQSLECPPYSQGYFPFLVNGDPKFVFTTTGSPSIPVYFLNMCMPALIWDAKNVMGRTGIVTVSPTVTAGAYSANNVVGGVLTFSNILNASKTGILESLRISFKSVQTTALKFWLFGDNPSGSTLADHGAPSIAAADISKLMGCYPMTTAYSTLGTHTIYNLDSIAKSLVGVSQNLYGVVTCDGTPTLASTSDMIVAMGLLQD